MATNINAGTTIGMSATLPATYDGTGYGVPVFTLIGEVQDIGELAKAYNLATHQAIANRYPEKHKDVYDISDISLTIGRVSADTGQVLLQTALASDASYSFKVTMPSGDLAYFTAKVTKAGLGAISTGSVTTTTVTLAVDPQSLYEA